MPLQTRSRDERGAAAILFAIFVAFGVFFGLAALAVDMGQMYEVRREAQRGADLAALAGGSQLQADPLDPQAACEAALTYLIANDSPRVDTTALPTAGSCSAAGSTGFIFDTDSDGSADRAIVEVSDASVRVLMPGQQVPFLLGIAAGQSSGAAEAEATVALRDIGDGIGPFAIPAGCLATGQWHFSIKSSTPDPTEPDCTATAQGSFGWLALQRDGQNRADDLDDDAQFGADHPIGFVSGVDPADFSDAPTTPPDCDGSLEDKNGVLITSYVPIEDSDGPHAAGSEPNCVGTQPGNFAAVSRALIGGPPGGCTGRLNDLTGPMGPANARDFDPCDLNGHRLADFLVAGDGDLSPVKDGDVGVLRHDIIDNPNFFVVPVLFTTGRPAPDIQQTPIVGFRGVFLDCAETVTICPHPFQTGATRGPITELKGFVFELQTIQRSPNSGPNVKDYYTGRGLSVPVLIR